MIKQKYRGFLTVFLVALAFIVQLLWTAQVYAEPAPIELSKSSTFYQPLVRYLEHARDDTLSVGIEEVGSGALDFKEVETPYADFNLGPARHWLWFKIKNSFEDSHIWRVDIRRQYMHELTIYARRADGSTQVLMSHSDKDHFTERTIYSRFLQADISVDPQETVDLYIAYRSTSVTYLPPAIGTIDGVANSHLDEFTIDALFNGGLVAMFVLTLLFLPFIGWKLTASFCAYILAGALFVFHADSYTFQYFWPKSPHFNDPANLSFMLLMPVFGLAFARVLFQTRRQFPLWDKVIFSFIICAALLSVLSPLYVHIPTVMSSAYAFVPVGTLIQLVTGIIIFRKKLIGSVPYLLGAIGVAFAFGYAVIAHVQPGFWSLDRTLDVGHASILAECFAFSSAIVLRMLALRAERDKALKTELAEVQRRLKTEKALRKSEADFAHANKLSQARLNQLTSVSHDLQAPLKTLRRVLGQIGGANEAGVGRIHAALDYLENLTQLEMTKEITSNDSTQIVETFSNTIIIDNIAELFTERASDENISFRQFKTNAFIQAEPIALMRIISNLVSNAIEHAYPTQILISSRRRGTKLVIQVWDNGIGMAHTDPKKVFKRGEKSKTSKGAGFGLSIAKQECEAQSFDLNICTRHGTGTCVSVAVPLSIEPKK